MSDRSEPRASRGSTGPEEWASSEAVKARLHEALIDEWGDQWDSMSIEDIAEAAVDALVSDAVLMTSERWDDECHACGFLVGDHPVRGGCPTYVEGDSDA